MDCAYRLDGHKVVITGAGGGIGASSARVCASLGAEVFLLDLTGVDALATELTEQGAKAHAFACDVSSRAAVETIATETGDVQAVVVLAAICPWDDWNDPDWDDVFHRVMDVNLLGAIHVVRAFMPGMMARQYGRIVIVSSLAGRMGGLIASPHYVASKGALLSLVKWLAQRGGPHNVIANGVAPASVDTEMMRGQTIDYQKIPLRRMAQPEEVAWPIAFLISPAASYICGTILDVNGGVYMG
ncbi:MAG: SDR family oxidoreductase [Candidatus Poribacteria bacterium]|nr:SDR family oxidoreductase [Candidatus Poribacteria bacterium]